MGTLPVGIAMWGYNYCHVGILSYGDIVVYRDLLT